MSDKLAQAFYKYRLNGTDRKLVEAAKLMLGRVIASGRASSAQVSSIAKLLHVFERLPRSVEIEPIVVTITSPREIHGGTETWFWWEFSQSEQAIGVSSGGHYYHPATGGDSFTVFIWEACPESNADYMDYSHFHSHIVPDLLPFEVAAAEMSLEAEVEIEVEDESNPLLSDDDDDEADEYDDDDDEDEDEDEEEDSIEEPESDLTMSDLFGAVDDWDRESDDDAVGLRGATWTAVARDASEDAYLEAIDPDEVNRNAPQSAYGLDECCICNRSFSECGLAVDGRLRGRAMWGNFCASCHARAGEGIGWGKGQLYAQQSDGSWRLVAGFGG